MTPVSFHIDSELLRPLIQATIEQTLAALDAASAKIGDNRLAYSEEEAAGLMGLDVWQLRDERRRKRINASQIVGRRIRYLRSDLVAYLMARRVGGEGER